MDKAKKVVFPLLLGLVITACMAIIVVGLDSVFGMKTGWIVLVTMSILLGMSMKMDAPLMKKFASWFFSCLLGMVIGELFAVNPLFFLIGAFVLTTGMVARVGSVVFNEGALIMMTIYTIAGVANTATCWMDFVTYGVLALIVFIVVLIVSKKFETRVQ